MSQPQLRPSPRQQPVLVVHGGAWAIPDDAVEEHETGIRQALGAGWAVLGRGGPAVEAVEIAISVLEDHPAFDAGTGAFLNRDGRVQLDALLMSGKDLRAGGVASVERLRNPIQAARLLLERSPHVYFTGRDAEALAASLGVPLIANDDLILLRERARLAAFLRAQAAGLPDLTFAGATGTRVAEVAASATAPDRAQAESEVEREVKEALPEELRWSDPTLHSHDTVGAVALDGDGNLAAGTSTGGTLGKVPGRVGDSSLIGCGCYADNRAAAVSLTGWGEPIMKLVLGKWAVDRVAAGQAPQQAGEDAIAYLFDRLEGHGGIILLGPGGEIGIAHNTPRMAWGFATPEGAHSGITRHGDRAPGRQGVG